MPPIDLEKLKKSPMFNASLGSKELFHSNMIAWMIEQDKNIFYLLFKDFLGENEEMKQDLVVLREHNNFDLTIKTDNYVYVIENKVKSIIGIEQLTKYLKKIKELEEKDYKKRKYKLILLAFTDNGLLSDDNNLFKDTKWYYSYSSLLDNLRKTKNFISEYYTSVVEDYCDMLAELVNISKNILRYFKDKSSFSDAITELTAVYKDARLHDFTHKLFFSKFTLDIKSKLKEVDFEISCSTNFTNALGLADLKYSLTSTIAVGLQIQGNQFRLSLEEKDNKKIIEHALNMQKDGLLFCNTFINDIEELNKIELKGKGQNQMQNKFKEKVKLLGLPEETNTQFNNYGGIFIYKYFEIPQSFNYEDVIGIVVKLFNKIHESKNELMACIK